ncbi:oxidoreductase [bacterium]|nr:oxidoreductase [bacterium]
MSKLHYFIAVLLFAAIGCASSDPEPMIGLSNPTWERQYDDSTSMFIGIHAVTENVVWAAGSNGRVVRTTDGGTNWKTMFVPGADSVQFRDVHAFDADNAFVLSIGNGPDSRIYKTTDGGETWNMSFQNPDPNAFFDCFSFWDTQRGFAFSDSFEGEFTLIETNDGGTSWSRIDPTIVPDARAGEGAFAASGTCVQTMAGGHGFFATGASAVDTRVIRTSDFGASWSEALTPIASLTSTEGISTMSILDDMHMAVLGGDYTQRDSVYNNVAVSADGGASWVLAGKAPIGGSVYGSSYVPGAPTPTLVGVAPTGSAFSTDNGQTWTRISDDNFWTVSFVNANAGWAAGPGGVSRIVNN